MLSFFVKYWYNNCTKDKILTYKENRNVQNR